MESKRQQKFGRQLQKDLSDIFQKSLKDVIGNGMVTITDVKVSPDLSVARCYLSFLLVENPQEMVNTINDKQKMLRNELANKIRHQVRIIPHLSFFIDDTAEYAAKIDSLFEGLVIPKESTINENEYDDLDD
ncbi:30S ribosome-binding factor RbfA [Sandaracinomonas limnophila]|uniref:Ribosome-binding factor A n=1 Tax=Sandaracinomonas limnophila TaxID=1862386 RepID=A0A437PXG4_9BACT|nr:30S ribosome-binding factor RbfA [Sandaracinomonas limnophila]RVU26930.1 30S ribosome-binding factor RbfA [Sandaracinomonas limnophila]